MTYQRRSRRREAAEVEAEEGIKHESLSGEQSRGVRLLAHFRLLQ